LTERLIIGTRGSKLALWQANWVKERLSKLLPRIRVELQVISTKGDRVLDVSLPKLGEQGKGLFTKELEDALFGQRVDLAVHSLKDLPTDLPDGLHIAAFCEREDVRDALVTRDRGQSLAALPRGSIIGTSSLRRQAQLKAHRPDLRMAAVRGNLDTRLRKLDEGGFDALALAAAGLRRLGYGERIVDLLEPDIVMPAVGQGALAIEARSDDKRINRMLEGLDHADTRIACQAERAFLKGLGGGCLVPIAAHAIVTNGRVSLQGLVASPDGSRIIRGSRSGETSSSDEVGLELARDLLSKGAGELLAEG
jgi:hydroxymethylbilane synthase